MDPQLLIATAVMLLVSQSGIKLEEPDNLFYCRVAFITSVLISWALLFVIRQKIASTGSKEVIKVPVEVSAWVKAEEEALRKKELDAQKEAKKAKQPQPPLTPMTSDKKVDITVAEYDLDQLKKFLKTQVISLAVMAGVHLYFGYSMPLVIQTISQPISVFNHALGKIYFRGQAVERPFPVPNPLGDLLKPKQE